MLINDITSPAGIAVDWLSSKLYWTHYDDANSSIGVAELDGSNCSTLIQGNIESPKDIVVHPIRR